MSDKEEDEKTGEIRMIFHVEITHRYRWSDEVQIVDSVYGRTGEELIEYHLREQLYQEIEKLFWNKEAMKKSFHALYKPIKIVLDHEKRIAELEEKVEKQYKFFYGD